MKIDEGVIAQGRRNWRGDGRSIRRGRGWVIGLGVAGALLVPGLGVAQSPVAYMRLTHPRETVMATRTTEAGKFKLEGAEGGEDLYVPSRCVGVVRCPLLIYSISGDIVEWLRPAADSFGIIVLTQREYDHAGQGGTVEEYRERKQQHPVMARFDARLKKIFQRFAIDPDKIAIGGFSSGGTFAWWWGPDNLDLFSRILFCSGSSTGISDPFGPRPRNSTTQFLFYDALRERDYVVSNLIAAPDLRQKGYAADHVLGLRSHAATPEAAWFLLRWLRESWAMPDPATRPAPRVATDSLPVLTPEALAQMTTFWARFPQDSFFRPDSIRAIVNRTYVREAALPFGGVGPRSVLMVDMPALAARYPAVAVDLKAAGLTAEQHDANRIALISAMFLQRIWSDRSNPPVKSVQDRILATNPVLLQNVKFLAAHQDAVEMLTATGMWEAQW